MKGTFNVPSIEVEGTKCQELEGRQDWTNDRGEPGQMNRLSLRNNWLEFMTAGKLPIILEEFIDYTPI